MDSLKLTQVASSLILLIFCPAIQYATAEEQHKTDTALIQELRENYTALANEYNDLSSEYNELKTYSDALEKEVYNLLAKEIAIDTIWYLSGAGEYQILCKMAKFRIPALPC